MWKPSAGLPDMRTLIPLSPELGNSEIGLLLDAGEEHGRHLAIAGGDVEVPQGGDLDGLHGCHCAARGCLGETMIAITFKGVQ